MKDLKQIQEFFSKPLNENKVTKEDFNKVVKILSASKYPFTIMLVPKWDEIDIITGQDSPDEIADDISQRLDSAGLNWGGNSGITISGDSSNYSRREYSDIFKVNGGHKDYYEESVNEMDINDPIMMRIRAAKDAIKNKKPDFGKEYGDAVKTAYGNDKNAKKLAFLKKERAQLMRDMEQEAEPEGGPIADEYGSKLNRIDTAIAKLSGRKEMTYDQAIAEDNSYASSFSGFSKKLDGETIENELQAKGYETPSTGIWNKILVMKDDERVGMINTDESSYIKDGQTYKWRGISNFINHVESINEDKSYARVSMPRFVFDKNNPNFLNVYIDYDIGQGGATVALGKETMTGQIRRESAAEAIKLAYEVAKDLEAEYDVEDIDVQDLENGKVRIFAVSDDFEKMNPNFGEETDYERRRKETNDYINESLNPEVTKALDRFIKAMAKRYDYSEKDAVFAIQAALKQRDFNLSEAISSEVSSEMFDGLKTLSKAFEKKSSMAKVSPKDKELDEGIITLLATITGAPGLMAAIGKGANYLGKIFGKDKNAIGEFLKKKGHQLEEVYINSIGGWIQKSFPNKYEGQDPSDSDSDLHKAAQKAYAAMLSLAAIGAGYEAGAAANVVKAGVEGGLAVLKTSEVVDIVRKLA